MLIALLIVLLRMELGPMWHMVALRCNCRFFSRRGLILKISFLCVEENFPSPPTYIRAIVKFLPFSLKYVSSEYFCNFLQHVF